MRITRQVRARVGAIPRALARREARRFLSAAKNCRASQSQVLLELLALNAGSRFSRDHRLDGVRNATPVPPPHAGGRLRILPSLCRRGESRAARRAVRARRTACSCSRSRAERPPRPNTSRSPNGSCPIIAAAGRSGASRRSTRTPASTAAASCSSAVITTCSARPAARRAAISVDWSPPARSGSSARCTPFPESSPRSATPTRSSTRRCVWRLPIATSAW